MKRCLALVSMVVLLGCALTAQASIMSIDTAPAWRGAAYSTFQVWNFDLDSNQTPAPDLVFNPYILPWATDPGPELTVIKPAMHEWQPVWGGHAGVWPLSGSINIDIPNTDNTEDDSSKLIQIQLIWTGQIPGANPQISIEGFGGYDCINEVGTDPSDSITLVSYECETLDETGMQDAEEYWYYSTYLVKLEPNPVWEHICISGNIMVDNVIVDTICPEPATMSLLGAGALLLLRRRRHG